MDWRKFIEWLFQVAEPYLAIRGDMPHTQVSHDYALQLLAAEGGDREIVEPAIILHDVGWSALTRDEILRAYGVRPSGEEAARLNRIHEIQGARIAREILESVSYDHDRIDFIASIISTHDSAQTARSIEERIVKDADKLWRFSKTGMWQELDKQGGVQPWEYYEYVKARIGTWFFTPTAIRLALEEIRTREKEILEWENDSS